MGEVERTGVPVKDTPLTFCLFASLSLCAPLKTRAQSRGDWRSSGPFPISLPQSHREQVVGGRNGFLHLEA